MTWKPDKLLENLNLYELLEVKNFSDLETLRRAYKTLALQFHPDRTPDCTASTRRFILGTEAYRVLSDPVRRKTYDRWLRIQLEETSPFLSREWKAQRKHNGRGVYSQKLAVDPDYNRFIDECRENFRRFLKNTHSIKLRPRVYRQEAMEPDEYDALVEDGRHGFQNFLRDVPRYRRHRR